VLSEELAPVRPLRAAPEIADFESFVLGAEPRLRGALIAIYGSDRGREATAESLAYAWEHWERVAGLDNPIGYLFRVAQSRSRLRKVPIIFVPPPPSAERLVEPGLPDALRALSASQRLAVVLVHAYGWRVREVAELTGVKPTTVQNHLERGLRRLRQKLGVHDHA